MCCGHLWSRVHFSCTVIIFGVFAQGKPRRARWLKSSEQHGYDGTAGVLRLRAPSAVSRDPSARRFAQDDGFVGELTKNALNKFALMGHGPVNRPSGLKLFSLAP